MKEFLEVPFVSATQLDASLFQVGGPSVRKHRHALRETLDPGIQFSLGRGGRISLNSVAVLDCLATARRWRSGEAEVLENAYREAGFAALVASKPYETALRLAREALQSGISGRENLAGQVSRCVGTLARINPVVQGVTLSMGSIMQQVDARLQQMKRLPGRLVRHEGPETLVVVDTGEREELRSVDGDYLKAVGLVEPGAPFVLHEFRWSPDTAMSLYFPAVDLRADAAADVELEQQLRAAETPLAWPPEELQIDD